MTIKQARIKLGLTQLQAAILCEISVNTFRSWEQGASKPTKENEEKLKKVLRIK
jgi:DNA-binding transcriptional regulator YiaG